MFCLARALLTLEESDRPGYICDSSRKVSPVTRRRSARLAARRGELHEEHVFDSLERPRKRKRFQNPELSSLENFIFVQSLGCKTTEDHLLYRFFFPKNSQEEVGDELEKVDSDTSDAVGDVEDGTFEPVEQWTRKEAEEELDDEEEEMEEDGELEEQELSPVEVFIQLQDRKAIEKHPLYAFLFPKNLSQEAEDEKEEELQKKDDEDVEVIEILDEAKENEEEDLYITSMKLFIVLEDEE